MFFKYGKMIDVELYSQVIYFLGMGGGGGGKLRDFEMQEKLRKIVSSKFFVKECFEKSF